MHKNSAKKPLRVAIYGASGFVGHNLMHHLLETTDYSVRAVCRTAHQISVDKRYKNRFEPVEADIFDVEAITLSLQDVDVAIYLIHMMAIRGNHYTLETEAANCFGQAAVNTGLPRIVYMSGLGNDAEKLSRHLASRHHTGRILQQYVPTVIELRASMIVGDGSIAYEIMKRLVHTLPIQTMPSWAVTMTQPISLKDALRYLSASISVPFSSHEVIEIGGPEQLSYRDLVRKYAVYTGKKPVLILVPILPLWVGALWLNLFTPRRHAKVGKEMVESLRNPMVVTNDRAHIVFPYIQPEPIESSFTQPR